MKIIELLNKIANGEEVPKKIKYRGTIWYLEQDFSNRLPYYKNGYDTNNLLTGRERDYFSHSLNDEVEIIEEEKKIPEKLDIKLNSDDENKVNCYRATNLECDLAFKINEIIDYLKSKGE